MRGTLVFPADDPDFLQLLEIRANNGGVETVETVYVLTGSTYFVPEQLFACDDPRLYRDVGPGYVDADTEGMVEVIDAFYEGREEPRLIFEVHTHPDGVPRPSDNDYTEAPVLRETFDRWFGDYELFLGIHAVYDECLPDPEWMRVPEQTAENEVSWWGENRRHTLAVFDGGYQPRPVQVVDAAGGML